MAKTIKELITEIGSLFGGLDNIKGQWRATDTMFNSAFGDTPEEALEKLLAIESVSSITE